MWQKKLHKNLIGYELIIFLFLKVFSIIISGNPIGGQKLWIYLDFSISFVLIYISKFWILITSYIFPMLPFYLKPMNCLCFLLIIIFDLIYIVISFLLIFPSLGLSFPLQAFNHRWPWHSALFIGFLWSFYQ